MGTRQEYPHTSGATPIKVEETGTCDLRPEDLHHKGAGSEAGRMSLTTQGPKNKKGEDSSSWNPQQAAQSTVSMGTRPA